MKPKCEIMAKKVLPSVRVAVVRELTKRYGMNQSEIAEKLGITQPAVSQYLNKIRGTNYTRVIKSLGLSRLVKDIAERIANENFQDENFSKIYCMVCAKVSSKVLEG